MSFLCTKLGVAVVAFLVLSSCSAKSTGFKDSSNFTAISEKKGEICEKDGVCWFCEAVIVEWDKKPTPLADTPEKLAQFIKETLCPYILVGTMEEKLCNALAHKEDVFAKAYFEHRVNHTIKPCTVTHLCCNHW